MKAKLSIVELVTAAFRKTDFLADTPQSEIEIVVRYPESAVCRPRQT